MLDISYPDLEGIEHVTGLDEANYDKSKCQDHFDAYKECKKQEV